MKIGEVQELVVALVDHGSEINQMSMDFYKKGKWSINTKHGWKIRAATRATEELHGACPNVRVKIGDVEIDQHFFVREMSSHPVILREPYITATRMETKVLDNGSAYARVKSQDGTPSVPKTERIFREGCQGVGPRQSGHPGKTPHLYDETEGTVYNR